MTAPTPFPYEDADHQLPTHRLPVRRPVEADNWDDTPYEQGDPILRAVTATWLATAITALMAAVAHGTYSPHIILGCFAAAITTAALGAIAYHWTDRKAGA